MLLIINSKKLQELIDKYESLVEGEKFWRSQYQELRKKYDEQSGLRYSPSSPDDFHTTEFLIEKEKER